MFCCIIGIKTAKTEPLHKMTVSVLRPYRQDYRLVHTKRLRHRHHNKRYVDRQNGMQPILPIIVPLKKIKGAARQCYGTVTESFGVN